MTQRNTIDRQLYYGEETTEGVDPYAASDPPGSNDVVVTNLRVSPDVAFYARSFLGQSGSAKGKIGPQLDPRLSFTVECRGGGTAITPKIDPLLKVVFADSAPYRQVDSGAGTIQAGSDQDTLVITGYTGTFTAGNAVAVETGSGTNEYEVGWIQSIAGGTITLTKPLAMASVALNARVKPSITYRPMNSGHKSLSFQMYLDATNRLAFVGCKGSAKFDTPALGAAPTLTFNWKAMGWLHQDSATRPTPAGDSTEPPTSYKFRIDGTDFGTKLANWDLGQVVARKRSHNSTSGTSAEVVTGRQLRGTFHAYDVDESQFSAWTAGTEQEITHQFGQTEFNIVAYQIAKAQRVNVTYADDNGLTTDLINFQGNITDGEDELRLAFL